VSNLQTLLPHTTLIWCPAKKLQPHHRNRNSRPRLGLESEFDFCQLLLPDIVPTHYYIRIQSGPYNCSPQNGTCPFFIHTSTYQANIPLSHKAPTAPSSSKRLSARSKIRARLSSSSTGPLAHAPKTFRPNAVIEDGFLNSKRDKRQIKHNTFLSRIQKSASSSSSVSASKRKNQRKRASKKLVTTLESLGDALDDILDNTNANTPSPAVGEGKIRHKSLRSRPGALKRKEKVVKSEMERFGKSLAVLAGMSQTQGQGQGQGQGQDQTESRNDEAATETEMEVEGTTTTITTNASSKATAATPTPAAGVSKQWAALRQFISSTMEQDPAFVNKK